ncbi:MAG: nicotinate-nucleotide adenylyltransferase [Ardenticatenia bacterium]|nr:nicotinate-nucleotide adenylyltransferase [Ardenticatenia bacterium]
MALRDESAGAKRELSRRAVLGGTFDPPHVGHLIVAEAVRSALRLDEVVFVPAGQPPHKRARQLTPALHRVMMVQLAIASHPAFTLSLVDINRPGPHYTVESVELLRATWGTAGALYYIVGADSLRELPTWHRPHALLAACQIVAVRRPGVHVDMNALELALPGIGRRLIWVSAPPVGVSSTEIRQRVAAGDSITYLVPAAVETYIREHGLYR